jgi:hypothetical protein
MATVFGLLLLVALGLLIWGLVAPKSLAKLSKKDLSRKHFGLSFGALAIVLVILIGVTSPSQPKQQTIRVTTTKTTQTKPTITEKTVTQTKSIPFTSTTVKDSSLAQGTTKVTTEGVNGVETLTYQDTYTNGKETAQKLISTVVTTKPIAQVTSKGTYVAPAVAPAATSSATSTTGTTSGSSCYPVAASGNCYEPGEYCSNADHGDTGVAGDGKSITCEDNDGWRWEPN